jgi:2-iminobutanoate/2-iminopropanoate deaminase
VFSNIGKTLAETGCKLTEIVIMTVFLIDACYMTRMTELRTALFGGDRFFPPAPRSR